MKSQGDERTRLYREAGKIARVLFKRLRESSKFRQVDSGSEARLGMAVLKCLSFQRSLLEHRPGPKGSEKKQLDRMQREVDSILSGEKQGEGEDDGKDRTVANG